MAGMNRASLAATLRQWKFKDKINLVGCLPSARIGQVESVQAMSYRARGGEASCRSFDRGMLVRATV